jgi:hypothetical protein
MTWYQSLGDQAIMSSNLIILIYLIKKIKHKVVWACASFKPKGLSLEGLQKCLLEENRRLGWIIG